MARPRITAIVTISFKEEALSTESPRPRKLPKKTISNFATQQLSGKGEVLGAPSIVLQGAPASSSRSKKSDFSSEDGLGDNGGSGSALPTNATGHTKDDTCDKHADGTNEYQCLIVEETPSPSNAT